MWDSPYTTGAALLQDALAWLDLLLETALDLRQSGSFLAGAAVKPAELAQSLEASLLPRREAVCPPEVVQALRMGEDYLLSRALAGVTAGSDLPLVRLYTAYQMNPLERLALLLSLAPLEHRKYAACFAALQGAAAEFPTDALAQSLYALYGEEAPGAALALCDPASALRRTLFEPDAQGPLRLRRRVWLWLHDSETLDRETACFCRWLERTDGPLLVNEAHYAVFRRRVVRGDPAIIQLCGRPGSGRRFFLRHLSADLGRPVLSVDLGALCACGEAERLLALDRIALEIRLTNCFLHLHGWPMGEDETPHRVLVQAAELSPLLFLSTRRSLALSGHGLPPTASFPLDELTLSQRQTLWSARLGQSPSPDGPDPALCAARYRLTPGEVERVCAEALEAAREQGRDAVSDGDLCRCVYRGGAARLEELATRVPPAFGWDDLILPPEQKDMLHLARERLRLRALVDDGWGFARKFAYGRGLSLMFCGPPGTGKTMAAQVLAREVGLELFRVDMSRLSSKYIGESEKNISRIFEAAQDSNAILFFDEADALFARRTDVQNSNDRYANAEVSFLLQKMEEYEGMCILSTNLAKNFDAAFFRRLTFVVRFQTPDADQRLALWRSAFPHRAPLDEHLDLKYFADTLELSGSSIKSIAYHAAYLAAAQGLPISRQHLTQALRLESSKTGQLFLPEGV